MMLRLTFAALLLSMVSVRAADRAIVANEQEVNALIQLIDEAVKSKGLAVAQAAIYWVNKLQAAPVVTDRKDEPPPAPSDKPKDAPQ